MRYGYGEGEGYSDAVIAKHIGVAHREVSCVIRNAKDRLLVIAILKELLDDQRGQWLSHLSFAGRRLLAFRYGLEGSAPHSVAEAAREFSTTEETVLANESRVVNTLLNLLTLDRIRWLPLEEQRRIVEGISNERDRALLVSWHGLAGAPQRPLDDIIEELHLYSAANAWNIRERAVGQLVTAVWYRAPAPTHRKVQAQPAAEPTESALWTPPDLPWREDHCGGARSL